MSEKLKPCPFCGGEPKFWDGLGTQADLTCDGCIVASVNMQVSDCLTQDEKYGNNGNAQPGFAFIGEPHYRYEEKAIQRVNKIMTTFWNTRHNGTDAVSDLGRAWRGEIAVQGEKR